MLEEARVSTFETLKELEKLIDELFDEKAEKTPQLVEVTNIDLKSEYMKIQRKKVGGSQQRIEDGRVLFSVHSDMQIASVKVYVQRFADWIDDYTSAKPENGWFELYTKMVGQKMATYDYMADLDSVYRGVEGEHVYGLFKNKGNSARNYYVFFVMVELIDQTEKGFCWPFLLKTKPGRQRNPMGKKKCQFEEVN